MSTTPQFDRIRGALHGAPRSASPIDLDGFERLRLAADPDLAAAKAEWEEAESERAYDRALARKYRGSTGGGLQCAGCKQLRPLGELGCGNCGYMDGGGYLPVPAAVSHLHRWR